jgi:hypothetical protein
LVPPPLFPESLLDDCVAVTVTSAAVPVDVAVDVVAELVVLLLLTSA